MMVMFKGKGCAECPFYHEDMNDEGDIIDQRCGLDGMKNLNDCALDIELRRDRKRRGDCPFKYGVGQIEVECYE